MDEMRRLIDRLNELGYHYYTLDDPIASDAEYDRLYDRLVQLERELSAGAGRAVWLC